MRAYTWIEFKEKTSMSTVHSQLFIIIWSFSSASLTQLADVLLK